MDTHFRQSGVSFEALASSYLRETPPQVQVPKHRNGKHTPGVAIQTSQEKIVPFDLSYNRFMELREKDGNLR